MESATARLLSVESRPTASDRLSPPAISARRLVPVVVAAASPPPASAGRVPLNSERLRELRRGLLLSQEELATQCWQRRLRVSIATLKRAETGRPVLFRTARALATFFDVPVRSLLA